ncbi:MAG: cytochrome c/FTR1 family iron permease [Gemmatimonadaceae bacterium]|nr:cytochrome c/FTR1 family iron permease [Gemmatimonadaceae bacterium]
MLLRRFFPFTLTLTLAVSALGAAAQEPVGKRLASVVGVAVEEYAKGVDESGRLTSAVEIEEAKGFLEEARRIAGHLATPNAESVRTALDSLIAASERRAPPSELRGMYDEFARALGSEGLLDLPSRSLDLAAGRALYLANCAACHGPSGKGGPAGKDGVAPPAIGEREIMGSVTPALTYRILSVGVQGTTMPAWDTVLTVDQRWDVVGYLNSMRATDADRARGRAALARICPHCADTAPAAQRFDWQVQKSDADLAAMLRTGDPATGLLAAAPVSGLEAEALVAALRADAIVEPRVEVAAADPREAVRKVTQTLDDAVAAYREGRRDAAADLAFDAYIAFEPLETNTRPRNPALIARMERDFADFRSAVKAGDLRNAEAILASIEREMPTVLDLAIAVPTPWGTFVESLTIILREGLEAILVLGAVVAFLVKTGNKKRIREIWIGAWAGIGASVVLAVLLRTALGAVPASGEVIEGITLLVAVVVLFSVSYWLLSKVDAAHWQQFIREKVTSALDRGGTFALALVAFLAVFREGAETALFFQAIIARETGSLVPVFSGIAVGGVALAVVFSLFHRFGVRIPLRPFFAVTSGILYWMAFVFAGKGIKELQEGGVLGRTLLPSFPYVEALGIYPTAETVLVQAVLLALLLFALWRTFLRPASPGATTGGGAQPVGSRAGGVAGPAGDAAMPPEVAGRLAELNAKARRLQDRVESLEKEVERETSAHPTQRPEV